MPPFRLSRPRANWQKATVLPVVLRGLFTCRASGLAVAIPLVIKAILQWRSWLHGS
ncbi:MAG TPA: hypothetical protein QF700_02190 [Prochlorococcus sp.]|nr:hypothetical protein [Prochlorococcus sp.]